MLHQSNKWLHNVMRGIHWCMIFFGCVTVVCGTWWTVVKNAVRRFKDGQMEGEERRAWYTETNTWLTMNPAFNGKKLHQTVFIVMDWDVQSPHPGCKAHSMEHIHRHCSLNTLQYLCKGNQTKTKNNLKKADILFILSEKCNILR